LILRDYYAELTLKKLPALLQEEGAQQVNLGRPARLMFEDEARFGRLREPQRCWAPKGVRPEVPAQIVREYEYAYAAVSPHDGVLTHPLFCLSVSERLPDTI
jgi:hypothetical protein